MENVDYVFVLTNDELKSIAAPLDTPVRVDHKADALHMIGFASNKQSCALLLATMQHGAVLVVDEPIDTAAGLTVYALDEQKLIDLRDHSFLVEKIETENRKAVRNRICDYYEIPIDISLLNCSFKPTYKPYKNKFTKFNQSARPVISRIRNNCRRY